MSQKLSNSKDNARQNEVDSGFLSEYQNIHIDDMMIPSQKNKKDKTHIQESCSNLDSGYIDEIPSELNVQNEEIILNESKKEFEISIIHQLNNLYINENTPKIKNKIKSQNCQTEDNWETFYKQNDEGDTQLHWACLSGYIDVVAALIRMTPHKILLDIQNDEAQAPIHIAAICDQPKIIRMLLIAGANVNVQDHHGNTPLHLACNFGNIQCVKALTEKINACEIKEAYKSYLNKNEMKKVLYIAKETLTDVEIKNYDGERCVHVAAHRNFQHILGHLLHYGADINAREGKCGRSALHIAIENKNESLVEFILEEGKKCKLNLNICTYSGFTAFQVAYMLENEALQRNLAKFGVKTDIPYSEAEMTDSDCSSDDAF